MQRWLIISSGEDRAALVQLTEAIKVKVPSEVSLSESRLEGGE
jgi:hypothetical protein